MDAIVDNFLNAEVAKETLTLIWLGIVALMQLVVAAFLLALVVGAGLAALRLSGHRSLALFQIWVVDVARALPPLVTLVVVFYLVPPINGFTLDTFSAAVLTFGIVQGAYISEIYRGGLAAIPRGQTEAATALGMSVTKTARWVIAPQVFGVILPPLTSQFTQLVRDSSLTYFIGYAEVVTRAKQAVSLTSNSTPYTMAVVVYAVLLISMQLLSTSLERRRSGTQTGNRAVPTGRLAPLGGGSSSAAIIPGSTKESR
jgi:His/Glu/Gln/Arg/opine family amino acid ABC transporter permease subunit